MLKELFKFTVIAMMFSASLVASEDESEDESISDELSPLHSHQNHGVPDCKIIATIAQLEEQRQEDLLEHPNGNSAYDLGVIYFVGIGVPKDDTLAINYFEESAQADNQDAIAILWWIYKNDPINTDRVRQLSQKLSFDQKNMYDEIVYEDRELAEIVNTYKILVYYDNSYYASAFHMLFRKKLVLSRERLNQD